MSVEFGTDRAALAGSETINDHPGGESDADAALNDPGTNAGQDGTPKRRGRGPGKPKPGVLVLTCTHCRRAIVGTGAGYAYVSLADTTKTAARAAAGYHDPAKARWTLAHRGCAPEALAPMSPHFRLWADRITTTDDLLDAMVTLSREGWFAWSDWGALARGILADTETATISDESRNRREALSRRRRNAEYVAGPDAEHGTQREYQRGCRCQECRTANAEYKRADREAARAEGLPEGDERHGTLRGYDYYGCRCPDCRFVKSETARAQYAAKTSNAKPGIER